MQEAGKDTIQVTLMGPPRIQRRPKLTPGQMQVNEDPEALEMIALLILSKLTQQHEGSESVDLNRPQLFERDWLAATLYPDAFAARRRPTQDRMRHKLRMVNEALATKMALPGSDRMRGGFYLHLAHFSVDVQAIVIAAGQLHREENRAVVIAQGEKRLLEGMAYPWINQSPIQELRQCLDDHYLNALRLKIESLLIKTRGAMALGQPDTAETYRIEVAFLVEKGEQRLRMIGDRHPLAPVFSHLKRKASDLLPDRKTGEPAAPVSTAPRHNIPRRINSFVGRAAEMAKLKTLLMTERLVTIKGMGGCGKTRLALQAALEHAERSGEETWLVELAGVADPALVPQTVAHVLGLSEQRQGTYTDALIGQLRESKSLLVLDNCEHLLEGCASVVEKLVQFCPNLAVLSTSREPLNIDGEHLLKLHTLSIPPANFADSDDPDPIAALLEYESARLFIDRLRPHDISISNEHVAAIVSICVSLDGIPLALELAAARASMLLLTEIDERLTDRFQLLTNGRTTALARHKTLRALVDWSYDLLTEQEQALLRRCSVFAGGWTMNAAQSVAAFDGIAEADVLGLLKGLIDKSLVSPNVSASPARYTMLETIRKYAEDQLQEQGELSATQFRHRTFYLRLAGESASYLRCPEPESWLDRLETETDNFRAALAWRADEDAMRLACALHRFWLIRSNFQEGRQWLERTWDEPERLPAALRATALMSAGNLAYSQNNFPEAKNLLEESLTLWRETEDRIGTAEALYHLGITATFQNNFPEAEKRLQESLALAIESENEKGMMDARQALGRGVHAQNNLDRARECYEPLLPYRRQQGDIVELADLLMYMGMAATYQDRRTEAREFYNESLAYATRLGRTHQIAQLNGGLAELARNCGEYAEARAYCDQSLLLMRKVGAKLGIASITNLNAAIAFDQEEFAEAERGFEQAQAMMLALGNERSAVGILLNMAGVAAKQGKYERADELFRVCLPGLLKFEAWHWIAGCLEEIGYFEAQSRPSPRAVILLGATDMIRDLTRFFRTELEKTKSHEILSELRAALGDDAFASAYEAGRAMTKDQAVAFALEE